MRALPTGTVTFLFTDVEGSTKLLHDLGAERYAEALAAHRRVLREAFDRHGGVEVDTQGDAFFVAFEAAPSALEAARDAQQELAVPVRMGIHTGTPLLTSEGYVGPDVHKAARIAAAGHGGQILVSSATAALLSADEPALFDLGEHRLKDLSAPERIYQVGSDEFPSLKTLYRTNLPVPATPFLGRQRELEQIGSLLACAEPRLVTLTGPGGTGKTRLSLQAAAEQAHRCPDGVFWVPLAPLRDPSLVLDTAARTVGATEDLADHLLDKRLLLVLDNFEHLIEAADELPVLLESCPKVKLLVTSREVLRIPGEQAYPVPPLEPQEGEELFSVRAQSADPAFSATPAVRELCAKLDNLPLAIELAAARVRVLSPEQLLERLSKRLDLLKAGRGADPRQQTLRATIEWSYDLLDEEEQRLFTHLAAFRGGCTIEAAEEVCDADIDTLQSLVEKSLVRHTGDRFWMLETIREYAFARVERSREVDDLRRRHARFFLDLAEEAEPKLREQDTESLDRLDREHANVVAALDYFEAAGERELALRLAGAAFWYWALKGHLAEGRRRVDSLLSADQHPTEARGKALLAAADLAIDAADSAVARQRGEEALALARRYGDNWRSAYSLLILGLAAAHEGEFERARELLEQADSDFSELNDPHKALWARRNVAWMRFECGDATEAQALHADVVREARAAGYQLLELSSLGALAEYALNEGRTEDALPVLRDVVRIQRDRGDSALTMQGTFCRFARAFALRGESAVGVQLVSGAEALCEEAGSRLMSWLVAYNEETLAMIRGRLDDEEFSEAWERGRELTRDEAVALALERAS